MAEAPKKIPEKTGRKARKAQIHNSSNRTIFLIPIQYVYVDDDDRVPVGIVVEKLARKIPVGGSIELDRSEYDLNSGIFIIFRAGDTDTVRSFLMYFLDRCDKLEQGEMLFLIGHLDNLSLECNDGKVTGGSDAGLLPPTTLAEAPIINSAAFYTKRRVIVPCQIPEWASSGLVAPPTTKIHNNSVKPICLIPISWVDGPDPQSQSVVRKDLVKKIPAGGFKAVDSREYDPGGNAPASQIRILFRSGGTGNDKKSLKSLGDLTVKPGEELYSLHYLSKKGDLFLSFNKAGQVIEVDKKSVQISGMEFFRSAQAVRLRNCRGQFLVANTDEETVALSGGVTIVRDDEETMKRRSFLGAEMERLSRQRDGVRFEEVEDLLRPPLPRDNGWWYVEFVVNSDSVHLKSCYGKYLTASALPSLAGMSGCKVQQSLPPLPDFSLELEPVKAGNQVKLRTHYGTFLCANGSHPHWPDSVTHDLSPSTAILWDVEVVKRVEEGTATNIDDKASSATKRRSKTGEGSSVTKTPSGDSGPIQEDDWVRYRHHFWKLKRRLLDNSGSNDLLVRGGSGTTALVREVCADLQKHFGTIAWITIPQDNKSALIHEEILLQLIFERVAFPENFDRNPWMSKDHEFSLQQKARCLIVVDNLDNPKTWKKFEEILLMVKTCRVIFIAGRNKDSSSRQIKQHACKFETYELEGLSYLPTAHYLKNFKEKDFSSPSKGVYELIVKKCQRLPTAIVFVLRDPEERWQSRSSYIIKDEWEARIPSDNLSDEFRVIQQVLETPSSHTDLYKGKGHELNLSEQVLRIIHKDDHKFCLLYLSILPEDGPISCETISRLWAAERVMTDLRRAEPFFKFLVSKKCIKPVESRSDGRLSKFQVDKHVQEIIVSLSDLRDPETITITSQGSTNWPERVKYLSVRGTIRDLNQEKTFELSSVSVPDVSSNKDKTTTSEARQLETSETPSFPSELKRSKVIDLTGAPFQAVPAALFQLTHARYFCLRNGPIKAISSSIEKLTRLEFLDAKHSLVTELPPEAEKLEKIRHILIYHHEKDPLTENYNLIGFKALCRVQGFKCLEKLCFVEADETMLKDLVNLTKLRRLGITKLKYGDGKLLCNSLVKLKELKSLNVHALEEDEIIDLSDLSSPPWKLKRLYLHGRLEKLPDWISFLNDLTKIILRWSQLEQDLLATLGKLQNLLELELRRAYDGEKLDFKKEQFPKLKILLLEELEGLKSMSLEQGTMQKLENLTISRCQWLERIPSGIEHIRNVRKLTFFDMSHEFYKKVKADHREDNYKIFQNIEEVHFTRWRAGHWETLQVESTD